MTGAHRPESNSFVVPGDEIIGLLTRDILFDQLEDMSNLNKDALIATLIPNRHLPQHDPAGYIIARHAKLTNTDDVIEAINTTYDLGVVYARNLVIKARPAHALPPVISNFDVSVKNLVDQYLVHSKDVPIAVLIRREDPKYTDLNNATEVFAQRCRTVIPQYMIDGDAAMLRGVHDYISAVTLIESTAFSRLDAYQRLLGKRTLGQRIMRLTAHRRD